MLWLARLHSGCGSKPGNAVIPARDSVFHLSPEVPDQPLHESVEVSMRTTLYCVGSLDKHLPNLSR